VATVALTLSYDGRGFLGSQAQTGGRTVQGVLAEALAAIYEAPVATVFAGRTDSGVHAAGQVVGLTEPGIERAPSTLFAALNEWLPDDVAVVAIGTVANTFNARFDARWREYRFRVWSGGREPLANGWVWRRSAPLDLEAMGQAAGLLQGTHDFASFVGGGEGVPWAERRRRGAGTVRTLFVSEAREVEPWWRPSEPIGGRLIEYRVVGNGFLPRMVRSLVSALVDVGRGVREPSWIAELLEVRDRRSGPGTAPPQGLTLWRVGYAAFPAMGLPHEMATMVAGSPPPGGHAVGTRGRTHRGTADLVTEGA